MTGGAKAVAAPGPPVRYGESYSRLVWRQFKKRRLNSVALWTIVGIVALAVFADFFASDKPIYVSLDGESYFLPNVFDEPDLRIYNNQLLEERLGPGDFAVFPIIPWGYNTHDLENVLAEPSSDHWLGTDPSGRDVMSRIIHGTRVSLAVGFIAVAILTVIGVLLGSLAGYYGGWVDGAVNRLVEIIVSIPTILLIPTIMAVIFATGWTVVFAMMTVIGIVRWTTVARLVRAEILRIKNLEYIAAAHALGLRTARIIIRHMLPNAIGPVLVAIPFAMANAILLESALSFLGFGIPDDMASWGAALNGVRTNYQAWWLAVFPGFAIFLTVTAYNLAGEGLRDAIDPRLKT
jgi:peptide/nickel transport system permease protein